MDPQKLFVEEGMSLAEVSKKTGIELKELAKRASEEGWIRLRRAKERLAQKQMERATEKKIEQITTKAAEAIGEKLLFARSTILETAMEINEKARTIIRDAMDVEILLDAARMHGIAAKSVHSLSTGERLDSEMYALQVRKLKAEVLKLETEGGDAGNSVADPAEDDRAYVALLREKFGPSAKLFEN